MADHPDLVVLRTFLNDIDAQLAKTALEAAEIDSMVRADDAGGMRPHLWVGSGVELVDLLRNSYAPYHFADSLGSRGLVFEYRLQPGPATTRNAITLLKLNGAPEGLVNRALERAADLDRARSLRPLAGP